MLRKVLTTLMLALLCAPAFAQEGQDYLIKANRASLERRYDEAIFYYSEFIKLNPKDFRGYFNRGTTEYNAGKLRDAVSDFSKCLNLNPIYKEAFYYRAKCHEALNQNSKAVEDYTHILVKDSNNVAFLKARAECYYNMKHFNEALTDIDKAASVHKLDGNIFKLRALIKIELGDKWGAIMDYDRVEALIPEYKMVHYLKGNLYFDLGMNDEACDEWQLAVDNGVAVAQRSLKDHCK